MSKIDLMHYLPPEYQDSEIMQIIQQLILDEIPDWEDAIQCIWDPAIPAPLLSVTGEDLDKLGYGYFEPYRLLPEDGINMGEDDSYLADGKYYSTCSYELITSPDKIDAVKKFIEIAGLAGINYFFRILFPDRKISVPTGEWSSGFTVTRQMPFAMYDELLSGELLRGGINLIPQICCWVLPIPVELSSMEIHQSKLWENRIDYVWSGLIFKETMDYAPADGLVLSGNEYNCLADGFSIDPNTQLILSDFNTHSLVRKFISDKHYIDYGRWETYEYQVQTNIQDKITIQNTANASSYITRGMDSMQPCDDLLSGDDKIIRITVEYGIIMEVQAQKELTFTSVLNFFNSMMLFSTAEDHTQWMDVKQML